MAPSSATILNQIRAYKPPGLAQGNFKALLEGDLETEDQSEKAEIVLSLREDLPGSVLYNSELLTGPHQLYRNLRDCLTFLGLEYRQHADNNRIFGLPSMFYNDSNEIETAMAYLKHWQNTEKGNTVSENDSRNYQDSNEGGNSIHHSTNGNLSKVAHNVATRYRTDEKFSGAIEEDIIELIAGYEEIAADYNLNEELKLMLFHNVFRDEPKRYYRSFINSCNSYDMAKTNMVNEYSGVIRQNRVRKHLQGLRLHSIMNQKQCSVGDALSSLRETISKLAPQGPSSHRSEEAKVEYLYKAVVGATWARSALAQVYSSATAWGFQTLYTALDAAWLQEQEESEGRQRDSVETTMKQQRCCMLDREHTDSREKREVNHPYHTDIRVPLTGKVKD